MRKLCRDPPPVNELEALLENYKGGTRHVDEVIPNLYLGDVVIANDKKKLKKMGITHILNAAHDSWECTGNGIDYGPDIQYYGITAEDCPEFNISVYFRQGAQFIHQALNTSTDKRSKLQNRSIEGLFVVYSENCKGYKILHPKTDSVMVNNSVTFIEDLNEDTMILLETKNEKNSSDITERSSDEKEVELMKNRILKIKRYNYKQTEPRHSIRENKGKPPIRLSYKGKFSYIVYWEKAALLH
ncbi:uncharacterized protein ACNLHF_018262 [Anomaloglossus baeobatrachus]|uniref:uncharacterized protein LOC142311054 isoform X1 n=1 Tax=Anomaloglossus baeobatrachus TaxID=238106 RepID=UPI003F4F9A2D